MPETTPAVPPAWTTGPCEDSSAPVDETVRGLHGTALWVLHRRALVLHPRRHLLAVPAAAQLPGLLLDLQRGGGDVHGADRQVRQLPDESLLRGGAGVLRAGRGVCNVRAARRVPAV